MIYVTIQCDKCGWEDAENTRTDAIRQWRAGGGTHSAKRDVCSDCVPHRCPGCNGELHPNPDFYVCLKCGDEWPVEDYESDAGLTRHGFA